MVLDAVLEDDSCTWLGTERDKRNHFIFAHPSGNGRLSERDLPRLVFRQADAETVRYFPDKLPIGVPREGIRYVFLYLMIDEVPDDFRLFLHRHREVLSTLYEWSIRVLIPRRFHKAAALYQQAVREQFMTPLSVREAEALAGLFAARRRLGAVSDPVSEGVEVARRCGRWRVRALRRVWEQDGDSALWSAQSHTLRDHLQLGRGRVEFVALNRQYLQLSHLLGVA
jgi:hypothetical protein